MIANTNLIVKPYKLLVRQDIL